VRSGALGRYTVTCRPPSYSSLSVISCPAIDDIVFGLLSELLEPGQVRFAVSGADALKLPHLR
jgi:hypothetical protein